MAISKAQQRATAKYVKANYDRIEIKAPKGTRDKLQAHAAAQGESVNAYVMGAVKARMAADAAAQPDTAPDASKDD